MTFYFPDTNVWVALNHEQHAHYAVAIRWYQSVPSDSRIVFCRQTQLGLLRLLSTPAVMGNEARILRDCWAIFDRWVGTGQLLWADDPREVDTVLRHLTSANSISPKLWADAYLAALAEAAGLTLVTFDKALAAKAKGAVLLA